MSAASKPLSGIAEAASSASGGGRGPTGDIDTGNANSSGGGSGDPSGDSMSFAGPSGTDLSGSKDTQLEQVTNVSTEEVLSGEAAAGSAGDATDPGSGTTFGKYEPTVTRTNGGGGGNGGSGGAGTNGGSSGKESPVNVILGTDPSGGGFGGFMPFPMGGGAGRRQQQSQGEGSSSFTSSAILAAGAAGLGALLVYATQ